MRIEEIRSEQRGDRARIAATVSWEDSQRPTRDVYFETHAEFSDALSAAPHAFLVGCLLPAMSFGEQRVFVEGEICPELRAGLATAMAWIHHWRGPERQPVRIEPRTSARMPGRVPGRRAATFFSGGIDSLANLRLNRLRLPPEHPGSFKDAVLVYGLNIESDDRPETFERAVTALSEITEPAGVTLIPVYTNIRRHLNDDADFFLNEFQASALAAVGHALDKRLAVISIASTFDIVNLIPFGTHPVLDPNYSSSDLRVQHDGVHLTRFEKVELVARWEDGLQNIKVCPLNWPGPNCGRCEKCVRTMLALEALGALSRTRAFPHEVSDEMVRAQVMPHWFHALLYEELLAPLTQCGRHDLVRAINELLARGRRETGWMGPLRRFDRTRLNGSLVQLKRSLWSLGRQRQSPELARPLAESRTR